VDAQGENGVQLIEVSASGLEQFDRVAVRIFDLDLFATWPTSI